MRTAYELYADRVYRTALHVLGQPADAEDALQDVFLRLFDKADGFRGDARVSTWIYRATVNHCINILRSRRRGPIGLVDDVLDPIDTVGNSPAAASERAETRATVHELLERLPEKDRTVLVLREIEELSYLEIAEVLDVPEGTVMSRLSRARARFEQLARHWEKGTTPTEMMR